MIEKLVQSLLDDDEGISSEAYTLLISHLTELNRIDLVRHVTRNTVATDGRFYYPEDAPAIVTIQEQK